MKKMFVVAMLALQFVGAIGLASTVAPFPECLPCKAEIKVAPFPECLPCKVDLKVVEVAPFPECLPCKVDLQ